MTKKFAVLGSPIAHSKSPLIHNYLFKKSGFDASYDRFEVASNLEEFLRSKPDYSGFSLTMPLKEQAFEIAFEKDADALATGGVNTLVRRASGWSGFNTDVAGIRNSVGFTPVQVLVIGSGATARSALQAFPNSQKLLHARNQLAAAELANRFNAKVVDFEEALDAELVVSTVTEGVLPQLMSGKRLRGVLLDCVYTNPEIPAQKYISGLMMLVHQAMIQQRIFQSGNPELALNNEAELLSGVLAALSMAK